MTRIMIRDSDSLNLYFRDIASSEPISVEEEVKLARQIRQGSQKAKEKLVAANLRFVVSVARRYQNCGVPLSDLISAGNMGLMNAAERFDETRGFKFISYAVWWIRQAIQQNLEESWRAIRLPANQVDLLRSISRASRRLEQAGEEAPELEIIAEELGVPVETVKDTLMHAGDVKSLDSSFREDEEQSLLSILPDHTQKAPDAEAIEASIREQIDRVLDTLNEREAQILRLHFGLGGKEPLTLEEIGKRFDLTRERVRQIKEKALERLRHARRRVKLKPLQTS